MLTKLSPIEHNIGKVVPDDIVIVRFRTKEDMNYKVRKSSLQRKEIRYKSILVNIDIHIHYFPDGIGSKKEKTMSVGLQSIFTSHDGSIKEHKLVFIVPGFDINKFGRACLYFSSDSLSPVSIENIDIGVRKEIEIEEERKDSLVFVSTWGIRCGIATYSGFLVDAIKDIESGSRVGNGTERKLFDKITIEDINEGMNIETIYAKICHIQHEFGIMPGIPRISKKTRTIVTFHSILTDTTDDGLGVDNLIGMGMGKEVGMAIGGDGFDSGIGSGREMGMKFTLKRFESGLNVVGYMVHNEKSADVLKKWTGKDVWVIDHGSYYIPKIEKEDARNMLEMGKVGGGACSSIDVKNDKIGFIFGFQSPNKNYAELIEVAKKVGIKLIISGAKHNSGGYTWNGMGRNDSNVIFLDRFLTEMEVNLYALASDVLLFSYPMQDHYSVSGALHRLIGSGRPCILSNTKHFLDVREYDDGVLKFNPGDKDDLERKIREGLERSGELGNNAREYGLRTSWENVAKRHLEIYSKYVEDEKEENKGVGDDDKGMNGEDKEAGNVEMETEK
jgi:glycosyltransferase involved in cell wall biosynthesis